MNSLFRQTLRWLTLALLSSLALLPAYAYAQQGDAELPPETIHMATDDLSARLGVDLTYDMLDSYAWSRETYDDASLGCPVGDAAYAQVVTPGYQFLLTYEGTVYDYRVSEDESIVRLCDTRPALLPTGDAAATPDDPVQPCGDTYTVTEDDILLEIARACNVTLAGLMNANPDIEDRSLIFPGQTLTIPAASSGPAVSLRPQSGPPGTTLRVFASGFPVGAQVQIGLGPVASEYEVYATREIGPDGELFGTVTLPTFVNPGEEWVAVVVLDNVEYVSGPFTVTEGTPPPTATPIPDQQEGAQFEQAQVYLVALGDAGQSGIQVGCEDSLVPVTVTFAPTQAPLTAALQELLAINTRTYGQSGLYNALYNSNLTLAGIALENGVATIQLDGEVVVGGVCDAPRIEQQLRYTALQFSTVDEVNIFLNGAPLNEQLS